MVDEVERRLADALAPDAEPPIEVAGLLEGAQRGARRIRRRRASGAAALVALVVAAVPLGTTFLAGDSSPPQVASSDAEPTPTSAPGPTTLLSEPTSDPSAAPEPPTESPVNPDVPEGLAGTVLVPPEAMLGPADLPFSVTQTNDYGPYLKNRTMVTSLCGDGAEPGDDLAIGGRQIHYIGQGQESLATTVRVFSGDGARQQLDFLRASLGTCDYVTIYTPRDAAGLPGDEALIGTAPSAFLPDGTAVIGAVRDGNTTAGVQVDVAGDAAEARALAHQLLTRAHQLLEASGLPAAHPG